MWIMLSNAFFSIVKKDCPEDSLLVRARRKGDIEQVFGVKATRNTKGDYLYRAVMPRHKIVEAMATEVYAIDYPNFKDSVEDKALKRAYMDVWGSMAGVQQPAPYSGAWREHVPSRT